MALMIYWALDKDEAIQDELVLFAHSPHAILKPAKSPAFCFNFIKLSRQQTFVCITLLLIFSLPAWQPTSKTNVTNVTVLCFRDFLLHLMTFLFGLILFCYCAQHMDIWTNRV